jgi:hypothetical protein
MRDKSTSEATEDSSTPQLTIGMFGENIVIRSAADMDEGYALAVAGTVNAAAATDTVVIIDPQPVRCDDAFAGDEHATHAWTCASHDPCEPVDAEVFNSGMIRIATERDSWTIDLRAGRFCRAAPTTDLYYLSPEAWVPIVAIIVTRFRLSALTTEGGLITSSRAHRCGTAARVHR